MLNGDPHLLHVALDAGVVEDREEARGQRQSTSSKVKRIEV